VNALVAVYEDISLHGGKYNFHYLSVTFIWEISHSYSCVNEFTSWIKRKI